MVSIESKAKRSLDQLDVNLHAKDYNTDEDIFDALANEKPSKAQKSEEFK